MAPEITSNWRDNGVRIVRSDQERSKEEATISIDDVEIKTENDFNKKNRHGSFSARIKLTLFKAPELGVQIRY